MKQEVSPIFQFSTFTSILALLLVAIQVNAQQPSPPSTANSLAPVVAEAHGAHAASVLLGLSNDLQTLSHAVEPTVVKIYATGLAPVADEPGRTSFLAQQRMLGAGAIMDSSGYILTNAHVVQHARSLSVLVPDLSKSSGDSDGNRDEPPSTALPARIIGMDTISDIAVIKVDRTGLKALKFGDSDRTHPGELVLAFGSPLGLQDSVSLGVISAVNRQLNPDSPMVYLQTDAAINPGNSGGPLVDMEGDLVGVNSMIESQSGGNEGLGFSIPSNTAKVVYEQIIKYGHARRGTIGIFATNLTPTLAKGLGLSRDTGVLIEDIVPDSPAAKAGLKISDILTILNGQPLHDTRQLAVQMFRQRPGDTLHLGVLSGTSQTNVDVSAMESKMDSSSASHMVFVRGAVSIRRWMRCLTRS
ncbi:S1C family serine protease, partial [Granulicella sp. L60]|uniref:S1C family serine protease n=1 Tax=Granulicella sp. L60 TaxID=1641866 RepID=UPI00131AFD56